MERTQARRGRDRRDPRLGVPRARSCRCPQCPGQEQGITNVHWEPTHAGAFAANFVLFAVIAPFVEELTFRGAGQSLLALPRPWPSILLVGLAFGLAHGLVEALIVLVPFGIGARLAPRPHEQRRARDVRARPLQRRRRSPSSIVSWRSLVVLVAVLDDELVGRDVLEEAAELQAPRPRAAPRRPPRPRTRSRTRRSRRRRRRSAPRRESRARSRRRGASRPRSPGRPGSTVICA